MKTYYFEYTQKEAVKAVSEDDARAMLRTLYPYSAGDFILADVVEDSDEPTQPGAKVIDLMAALKDSLKRKG